MLYHVPKEQKTNQSPIPTHKVRAPQDPPQPTTTTPKAPPPGPLDSALNTKDTRDSDGQPRSRASESGASLGNYGDIDQWNSHQDNPADKDDIHPAAPQGI